MSVAHGHENKWLWFYSQHIHLVRQVPPRSRGIATVIFNVFMSYEQRRLTRKSRNPLIMYAQCQEKKINHIGLIPFIVTQEILQNYPEIKYKTVRCQHWFKQWQCACRRQTIHWANVDYDLCPPGYGVTRGHRVYSFDTIRCREIHFCYHWFTQCRFACLTPNHCLKQWWLTIVLSTKGHVEVIQSNIPMTHTIKTWYCKLLYDGTCRIYPLLWWPPTGSLVSMNSQMACHFHVYCTLLSVWNNIAGI